MRRATFPVSAFALIGCITLLASLLHALSEKEARAIYEADSQKLSAHDVQFDWKEFRLAAAEGGTSYFDWHPVRNQFMQELNAGDLKAVLKRANEITKHNLAEPEGHLLAMMAYQKLGQQTDAAFEHDVVAAYLASITGSGDGKSSDSAYFVVNEGEEYFFINIVMGVGLPESQSLVSKDGHSFDLLKIKNRDNAEQEVWFNVDTSMNSMKEAIEGANYK
jgi:hypothetical protein